MNIRFYMDVHVPRAVTSGLRLRGVDVLTAQEDHTDRFSDAALLDRATEMRHVLFSQDDDLLREATLRQRKGTQFAGLIYARQQHITIGRCVEDLELIARASEAEECANWVQYLPMK